MTLTFNRATIEINRTYVYFNLGGLRDVFIRFGSGFPFWDFESRRSGDGTLELWGLGLHVVLSRVSVEVPA